MSSLLAGRRFSPALHWTAAALLGVALLAALGVWQLRRAAEKQALFDAFAASSAAGMLPAGLEPVARYSRASAYGRYDASRQFLLDNMSHDGTPGFHVLTPLMREDGSAVIVDRGFVALAGGRSTLPELPVDAAPRQVTGRVDFPPRPAIELAAPTASGWPRLVSFPRVAELAAALEAPVYPQLLLLDPGEPDGFLRDWRPPGIPPERHIGYAVQWFGMAAAVGVIWFVLSLKPRQAAP